MIHLPACPTLAKALHDGATVIRVPVVPQPYLHPSLDDIWIVDLPDIHGAFHEKYLASVIQDHSPLGKPGDVVGVKEPWRQGRRDHYWIDGKAGVEADSIGVLYETTFGAMLNPECEGFSPVLDPSDMPNEAIRLRYGVKAARVERLSILLEREVYRECRHINVAKYERWWNSRLTPDEYDEDGNLVRKGERYGDVYPFDENPFTVAAEVVREEEK